MSGPRPAPRVAQSFLPGVLLLAAVPRRAVPYYALTMVQFGLEHIVDTFSRDYFLEYIEHEAENALNPGTYPRLSLGPGQRFASKGAYIVKLSDDPKQRIETASDWIVP